MILIQTESGHNLLMDCNVTNDNENRVLTYIGSKIGWRTPITAFICSHRDADHIRGIEKVREIFPIREIWDSGYPGTTTTSSEYRTYMNIRNQVEQRTIARGEKYSYGSTKLVCCSARDDRLADNANAQGVVLKVEHRLDYTNLCVGSAMLTGDSDADTWKNGILRDFHPSFLKSSILMAGHHGSRTFFESSTRNVFDEPYTSHIEAISPDMCVISVGDNGYGHPDSQAMRLYENFSRGTSHGMKLARTDFQGSMSLEISESAVRNGSNWEMTYFG